MSTNSRFDPDLGYINIWFGLFSDHHQKLVSTKRHTDPDDSNRLSIGVELSIKTLSHKISDTIGLFHI